MGFRQDDATKINAAIQRTAALTKSERSGRLFLLHAGFDLAFLVERHISGTGRGHERTSVLLAAAGAAAGFFALPLAKAAEVETAKIARPTTIIFFILSSLEKEKRKRRNGSQPLTLITVKNRRQASASAPASRMGRAFRETHHRWCETRWVSLSLHPSYPLRAYFLAVFNSSSAALTPILAFSVRAVGCSFHSETSFSAFSSSGLDNMPANSFTFFLGATFESLKYA